MTAPTLCEYAHARAGPGNTEAYWQEIYSYDSLMGGCVWEMVDHAVLHKDGSWPPTAATTVREHDRNFCVDACLPDRSPPPAARLIRFIYRLIRCAISAVSSLK